MDFSGVRRRKHTNVVSTTLSDTYPLDLQMYSVAPGNIITLTEFEDLALERLKLLRIIDQATQKGHRPFSDDWKTCIKQDIRKENLKKYSHLLNFTKLPNGPDYEARRADHISHFILRLAYCRTDELRRWFLAREMEFFKLRFLNFNKTEMAKFFELNDLKYKPIPEEVKEKMRAELIDSTVGMTDSLFELTNFYEVPFGDVLSLVKSRRVYLHLGFAYIPDSELVVCVSSIFRSKLSEALIYANRNLPKLDDNRINDLLQDLHLVSTTDCGYDNEQKDAVNIASLDMYSKKHYPLCMRHLHEVLRSVHHLKHFGRLQYGFFIKALGVTYEDAMRFWREEFTKVMDGNQFEKRYSYNIQHSYGKTGKMQNYSAYGCMKIITGSVGPGEHHGCPFKHWDIAIVKQKFSEYGLDSQANGEILELCAKGQYQLACTKYFEATHGQPPSNIIQHPNQYAEESLKIAKADKR